MPPIALLVPCLTKADAVSNDVLGMYHVLEAQGHEVCIFAFFWNISGPRIRQIAAEIGADDCMIQPATLETVFPELIAPVSEVKA